jgi:hypothetical protein
MSNQMFHLYCSVAEAERRQFENDIHFLEATKDTAFLTPGNRKVDPEKIVAKYYRSGTSNAFKGAEPRPLECLERTVDYLLECIWRPGYTAMIPPAPLQQLEDLLLRYNFCMDRLAAVRQDITVGRFSSLRTRALLLRIAEFYLHALVTVNYAPTGSGCSSSCTPAIHSLPSNAFDTKNHEHALSVVLASVQQFTDMNTMATAGPATRGGYSARGLYYQSVLLTLFLALCKSISTSYGRAVAAAASAGSAVGTKRTNTIELDASVAGLLHSYRGELAALLSWSGDAGSDADIPLMARLQAVAAGLLFPMVTSVRQGNPSRAMKLARRMLGPAEGADVGSLGWQLGAIYFCLAQPDLRLWRLHQLYAVSNITNNGVTHNRLTEVGE